MKKENFTPEYGFEKHKGYGTKAHIEAIEKYGVLPKHRKTFEPVRSIVNGKKNEYESRSKQKKEKVASK